MQRRHPPSKLQPLGAMLIAGLAPLGTAFAAEQAAAPSADKALPTVRVEAEQDKPQGPLVTTTRVGKTLQNPQDIPQAITSVPETLLREQQANSLKEAMRNVAGVSFNAAEGGRAGDNMNLRGFYTFGDMYLDGIRDTAQYNRETFNLEQIDVLRGAGAMLFGRGQAGGVINQVTKLPKARTGGEVSISGGTRGYQEFKTDVNGAISDDVGIRANLMRRDEGSWRQNPVTGTEPEIHRQGHALSLALNQTKDSKFWINYLKTQTRDTPDFGNRFDGNTRKIGTKLPASTFFGTGDNFDDSDTRMFTLINETRLSSNERLRTQVREADYQRSYWAKTPSLDTLPDAQNVTGGNVTRMMHYKTLTVQSDYNLKTELAGMKYELLAGLEYLKEENSRRQLSNLSTSSTGNPPMYLAYTSTLTPTTFTGKSYAVYAQNTLEVVPDWKVTAGVRRDDMRARYSNAATPELKYAENSYRAALSWQPSDAAHYYLGLSDSFSPTADLYSLTTVRQPAERSNMIELGAKWMLFEGDLALRTSLYQATKDYERNTDIETTAALLTKKRRTRGLEVDLAGRITEDWEVFGGLALMNAKILEVATNYGFNNAGVPTVTTGNPGFVGKRARNTPEYALTLWSTYKVDGNWKVGGGAEVQGDRLAYQPQSATLPTLNGQFHPNTAQSYVRWDAMVHYDASTWSAKLNIKNVFNKLYYESVYENGGFAVPGPRRTIILTATRRF